MTLKINSKWLFVAVCSVFSFIAFGQQKSNKQPATFGRTLQMNENLPSQKLKCVTPEYDLYLREAGIKRNTDASFESWLAPKIQKLTASLNTDSETVLNIPVVVHVIHNNKAYGVEENILDEQIASQITVLNQDFRKLEGTPGFNTNPVGADVKIEFCMAQRDPAGNATNGINRVSLPGAGADGWEITDVEQLVKPQTQWNPNEYLNIWVVEGVTLFGLFEILGYAQFPTNSTLEGLDEGSSTLAFTDGVVIGHKYFGGYFCGR
jgi:hypothetical protein